MVVLAIIGLAFVRLSEVLPIVGMAVILAYLLSPVVNFIEHRVLLYGRFGKATHRNLAVILTYILIVAVVIIVVLVVVPVLVRQIEDFGRMIPGLIRNVEQGIEQKLSEPLTFNGEPIALNGEPFIPLRRLQEATGYQHLTQMLQIQDMNLVGTTQTFIGSLTGPAFDFVGGALTAVINTILLFSMMFFLMRDGSMFIDRSVDLLPPLYRGDLRRILYELGRVWHAYLRGQITLAIGMGSVVVIIATLLGLPNPAILGMISGLLEFIPSIGSGLAIFPAALLALTSQSSTIPFLGGAPFAVVVIIAWAVLQNIEAIILVPRIMGGSLNLHPFVVIVSIIVGATVAGVLGIVLAAPAVASLRIFGQYIYGKLMDKDPFPPHIVRKSNRMGVETLWHRMNEVYQRGSTRFGGQLRGWRETKRKEDHA